MKTRYDKKRISLPKNVLSNVTTVIYSLFQTTNLFHLIPPADGSKLESEISSEVIGLTLLDLDREILSELPYKIRITFQTLFNENQVCLNSKDVM